MSDNKKRKYHVTKCYFLYILAYIDETASCEYMEEVSYLSLSDKYVFPHFARKRFTPTQDATLVVNSVTFLNHVVNFVTCNFFFKIGLPEKYECQ